MADLNDEQEQKRLARQYAGMSDAELEKLAGEAGSLTDTARETLRAELARRSLKITLQGLPMDSDDAEPLGPVTIRRYRDLPRALLARTILESAGVECFLADEHIIRMDWLWSNFLGGVKVWVRAEDVDAAILLDQDWIEAFHVEGVGEYKQPRCPVCESFDISYRELIKRSAYASILFSPILLSFHRPEWKCHTCGHIWEEEEGKELA